MNAEERQRQNEEFVRRLIARRPQDRDKYEGRLRAADAPRPFALEGAPRAAARARPAMLETIVREERPVLFVQDDRLDTKNVTLVGAEARDLVEKLGAADDWLRGLLPLVGRIDVTNFPGEYVGTGWFVAEDVVVTNRHVASLVARWDGRRFAFNAGIGGRPIGASLCTTHEREAAPVDPARAFAVEEVLYIEPDAGPNDVAFLRVARRARGDAPPFVPVDAADVGAEALVCVVGYPARASRSVIPDQALMDALYLGRYDVKRVAPGYTAPPAEGTTRHDCTTLGGNSGSLVLDLRTRKAAGLHFAGLYQETNYAVRASVLAGYVARRRWNEPYAVEARPPPAAAGDPATARVTATAGAGGVTVTIPIAVTVTIGTPAVAGAPPRGGAPVDAARAEAAVLAFWDARPPGVVAARVGYLDDGDAIGDEPCIAAAVPPSRLAAVAAAGPATFDGVPVRYLPAEPGEQLDLPEVRESVEAIRYDDDARTGSAFSLEPVEEPMDVLLHVGPEYSWDTLRAFLDEGAGPLVAAMYEFHSPVIKDALERRLERGAPLTLVLDSATFAKVRDEAEAFDRARVFREWQERFRDRFERIVVPEGTAGLVSDAYHIKVAVRDDGTFWLSSGNWKMGSSQPVVTQADRDAVPGKDLPGNREWHVVIANPTLAGRFRRHVLQDLARSRELGGGPTPRSRAREEAVVEVALEEAVALERRPPGRVLPPERLSGPVRVRPLLTPDREGAVYSEAVLELIESARESLLFQIPYVSLASSPRARRGYIDALIQALVRKLKTLEDARVILRNQGSAFSSPTHVAWYLKSKGVDVARRLRTLENHHTKGMIVDGRRILLGSHNWSKPGVTLNRDASLLFDDARVASYYAKAFELDWARANPVRPRRYVRDVTREAVGGVAAFAYRRVSVALLGEP